MNQSSYLERRRIMREKPKSLRARFYRLMSDRASWELLVLCLPTIILLIMFHYYPWFSGMALPFKKYRPVDGIWGSQWVGLKNFAWIASSSRLWRAVRNSVLYGLWWLFLDPIANVGIALLLFDVNNRVAIRVYRTAICFPMFISMVVVSFITNTILSPRYGILNQFLAALGMETMDVYMTAGTWPVIFTFVHLWLGIGSGSMLYYASLTGIDASLYEAASIDGANHWQRTRYISIPHLIPIVALSMIMGVGGLIGGSFDMHYLIPLDSATVYSTTDILPTFVTRALLDGDITKSAASGFMTSLASSFLVITTNLIVRKISPENAMF